MVASLTQHLNIFRQIQGNVQHNISMKYSGTCRRIKKSFNQQGEETVSQAAMT
jgi:hypothetical protein